MADELRYTTVDGDTYDMIALNMYHDEFRAPLIAGANPEQGGTGGFPAGGVRRGPGGPAAEASAVPPWRR